MAIFFAVKQRSLETPATTSTPQSPFYLCFSRTTGLTISTMWERRALGRFLTVDGTCPIVEPRRTQLSPCTDATSPCNVVARTSIELQARNSLIECNLFEDLLPCLGLYRGATINRGLNRIQFGEGKPQSQASFAHHPTSWCKMITDACAAEGSASVAEDLSQRLCVEIRWYGEVLQRWVDRSARSIRLFGFGYQ